MGEGAFSQGGVNSRIYGNHIIVSIAYPGGGGGTLNKP